MNHNKKQENKMKKKYKIVLITLSVAVLVLIVFRFYFNDEKVYISEEYSPSGKLIGTNEYVIRNDSTIMQGKFVNYNEKGIKISEGQFVDNEPYGLSSYYYDNGKIKSTHYKKNSKINLESTFYNAKGLINKYVVYDYLGNYFFTIYFDEKGATRYDGHFQIETYQYKFSHKKQFNIKEDQYLKVGDVLKYSYIVANIPNSKRSFKIENVGIDNLKVKRTLKNVPPAQIDVEEVLTKKGKNTIRSIVRYEFNDKVTPVFTDTLSFEVNVH